MNMEANNLILEVKVVLQEQVSVLKSMLEIMQEERELLVQFRPQQLTELNKRKELLAQQHAQLERNRQGLSEALVKMLGLQEEPSLKELADLAGGQLGQELLRIRSTLSALADGIGELNKINQSLIEHSIRSVKSSVAFLKKKFFNTETYNAGGVVTDDLRKLSTVNSRV